MARELRCSRPPLRRAAALSGGGAGGDRWGTAFGGLWFTWVLRSPATLGRALQSLEEPYGYLVFGALFQYRRSRGPEALALLALALERADPALSAVLQEGESLAQLALALERTTPEELQSALAELAAADERYFRGEAPPGAEQRALLWRLLAPPGTTLDWNEVRKVPAFAVPKLPRYMAAMVALLPTALTVFREQQRETYPPDGGKAPVLLLVALWLLRHPESLGERFAADLAPRREGPGLVVNRHDDGNAAIHYRPYPGGAAPTALDQLLVALHRDDAALAFFWGALAWLVADPASALACYRSPEEAFETLAETTQEQWREAVQRLLVAGGRASAPALESLTALLLQLLQQQPSAILRHQLPPLLRPWGEPANRLLAASGAGGVPEVPPPLFFWFSGSGFRRSAPVGGLRPPPSGPKAAGGGRHRPRWRWPERRFPPGKGAPELRRHWPPEGRCGAGAGVQPSGAPSFPSATPSAGFFQSHPLRPFRFPNFPDPPPPAARATAPLPQPEPPFPSRSPSHRPLPAALATAPLPQP